MGLEREDGKSKKPMRADTFATTTAIVRFLEPLKREGIEPKFVGLDKDAPETAKCGRTAKSNCATGTPNVR